MTDPSPEATSASSTDAAAEDNTQPENASITTPPKKRRGRRYFPGLVTLGFSAAALLGLLAVHWGMGDGDGAIINILTLVLGFFAILPLVIWFVFFSAYLLPIRLAGAVAFIALNLLPVTLLKVSSVDARLVPTFEWRWTAPADTKLASGNVAPAEATYDLKTTTPADFPQFLGPDRNSKVTGVELAKDWSKNPPQEIWRKDIGAGWSGFVVVNGFAVTMEQRGKREMVTCYRAKDGELLWSTGTETRHETLMGGIGPRSTPTIHDGKVYALGATGVLRCLDGATGKEVWKQDLLKIAGVTPAEDMGNVAWGRSTSPLIAGDLVIAPVGGPADGDKTSLMAFDTATGETVWKGGEQQVSYSSPALGTIAGVEQVVVVNEDTVAGHDLKTGEELWRESWPGHTNGDANTSQPHILSGDRVLVSKGYGAGARMMKIKTGEDNAKYTVEEVWRSTRNLRTKLSNLVTHEGYAYGLSDGILQCVNLETGKQQWKKGRYAHGQLLIAGDVLLVIGERDGVVRMIELNPQKMNVLGEFKALDGQNWNTLCLTGDKLLVRNNTQAACFRLPLRSK